MRKDVKLGLAIGAIFLAVVIVWAAVPKKPKHTGVTLNSKLTSVPSAAPQGFSPADSPSPAPAPTNPDDSPATPPPGGETVNTGGTTGGAAPKPTAEKSAPDWATLLRASDDQLPALIGQSRAAAEAVDHPSPAPPTPDMPAAPTPGSAPAEAQGHGGMIADTGLADPATRPAADLSSARTHTVQSGETLASIAKAVYGKSGMYLAIEKANPTVNPNRLRVGTVLKLPAAAESSSSASSDTATVTTHRIRTESAVSSITEYRVQPGDSLHRIAMKLYGNAAKADELYTTNKDLIGPDPAKLKVGQVLKLPEPPTASVSR